MNTNIIEDAFNNVSLYLKDPLSKEKVKNATFEILKALESGDLRIVTKTENDWVVNEYAKKALSLFLKFADRSKIDALYTSWNDKVPLKKLDSLDGPRVVPGSIVRFGAYVSPKAVLCPCFVNIGAYVDDNSMIDSFTTVGSSAYIGKNCHISEGVCIGGVLEPVNATPVIIEDNCFIGAKSVIAEGVIVKRNSIIAASTTLTKSTKIIMRDTNEIIHGYIPENSLIVPGSYKISDNLNINCAIAMHREKHKDIINELLR